MQDYLLRIKHLGTWYIRFMTALIVSAHMFKTTVMKSSDFMKLTDETLKPIVRLKTFTI